MLSVKSSDRCLVLALLALLVPVLALTACQREEDFSTAPPTLRVSGAWALYPLMVKWAKAYHETHPDQTIDVTAGGTGKGVSDIHAELGDLAMLSRPLDRAEIAWGARAVPVAQDAVFPTINAANPALAAGLAERGFTRAVLADLFLRGKKLTWGEVVGADAKTKDETPIDVYTRADEHGGAGENWARYLGGKDVEDLHGVAVYGDPGVARAVTGDPRGLGFNNLNVIFDRDTGESIGDLRVAPMDLDGDGAVSERERIATRDDAVRAIAAGIYPSPPARYLWIARRGAWTGPAAEFVRWVLTDGQRFVAAEGYLAPRDADIARGIRSLDKPADDAPKKKGHAPTP